MNHQLNIVHVIPSLRKGGAERLTIDICNALAEKGHRVLLISMSDANEFAHIPFLFEYKVVSCQITLSLIGQTQANNAAFELTLDEFKPHVIHSHLFLAELLARWKPRSGVKYFSHLHDNMFQFSIWGRKKSWKQLITDQYEKRMLLKLYRQCNNQFIAISADTHKYFSKNLPAYFSQRIYTVPNAIDYNKFYRGVRKFTQKTSYRLITVGSLVPKKNQQFLVSVLQELDKILPGVCIDILGDGPEKMNISNQITMAGLSNRIILHGNVNQVEDLLHQADLYVHPATYEPFGLVLLEAMAAGLPCVCLDGRGNRDIVVQGKNGFLLNENNPALFAQTTAQLLSDTAQRQVMSDYSIGFAKNYDIRNYIQKLLEAYVDCCYGMGPAL